MKLNQLIADSGCFITLPQTLEHVQITGLSSDSRFAQKGDLFFAKKGEKNHGLDFIETLVARQVGVIFYEAGFSGVLPKQIPCLLVDQLDAIIFPLAQTFYHQIIMGLTLMGITGTEGKTSVSQFIAKALAELNQPCGLIGTNGIGLLGALSDNTHTTPDFLSLYRSLTDIKAALATTVLKPLALEVTSHALEQKRIAGLDFAVTTLTNFARDHLDYHKTLEAYAAAKKRLFLEYHAHASVINTDDVLGIQLFTVLNERNDRVLYPYGQNACAHPNYLHITQLQLTLTGIEFKISYQNQTYQIQSCLFGHFNAYNLVATLGNLLALGYDMDAVIQVLPKITTVEGRMEYVPVVTGAIGIIDYAHKPNALLQVLTALHQHRIDGAIYCVFGCGGDRDRGKRPLMAQIAEAHADYIIVTNDNPRTEDPEEIAQEIVAGFSSSDLPKVKVIIDRKDAINHALTQAKSGDLVVIAGKGHENYQILGNTVQHFSDVETIHEFNKQNTL